MPFSTQVTKEHREHRQVASLGLISMNGTQELGQKVDYYLQQFYQEKEFHPYEQHGDSSFLLEVDCPRFQSGDGKAMIHETVRGNDLYIMCDIGNYNCKYNLFGQQNSMSPDDHFQDLKRLISASAGKAKRINVVMPLLYNGRQHKRMVRESLDCAEALRELANYGVANIVTFDAHDVRVQNAIPHVGFENGAAYYQFLKELLKKFPDLKLDKESMMIVSPDEGAVHRNLFYASIFGLELGVFYKVRDYGKIVNGRNPIVAHEFIGGDVEGKDVIVIDDILSSGESILDIAKELKRRKARRIFFMVTYALFANGLDSFNEYYEKGMFDCILATNLTYLKPELKNCPWFAEVDMTKYVAKIIDHMNYNESLAELINPSNRVIKLMERVKNGEVID